MESNSSFSFQLITDDYDWQAKNELDLILYLNCGKPAEVVGGKTQYIAIDEKIQQALITLFPEENVCNFVFRDTARVTRYVSHESVTAQFYMLVCSYSE